VRTSYFKGRKVPLSRIRKLGLAWQPWRSVATWYLWRSLDPLPVEY
jgi:DNA-3-methyladenine glycosylase II